MTTTERRLLTQRLIAAVLWHEEFASRSDSRAAQNELDEARRLAHELDGDHALVPAFDHSCPECQALWRHDLGNCCCICHEAAS